MVCEAHQNITWTCEHIYEPDHLHASKARIQAQFVPLLRTQSNGHNRSSRILSMSPSFEHDRPDKKGSQCPLIRTRVLVKDTISGAVVHVIFERIQSTAAQRWERVGAA